MEIRTFGGGGRLRACERALAEYKGECQYGRLLLLPIPTTKDKIYITGTNTSLAEFVSYVNSDTLVAGYNIPDKLKDEIHSLGGDIYDAGEDEDFLLKNADLTAHGAVGKILCLGDTDISEYRIGVVGYGRIGKRMTKLLLLLGGDVTVYTTTPETAVELGSMGICAELICDKTDFSLLDILVNTAPAKLISDERIQELTEHARIIDLASGRLFPESDGIEKLASIPEVMYPVTAGELYARHITEHLTDGGSDIC